MDLFVRVAKISCVIGLVIGSLYFLHNTQERKYWLQIRRNILEEVDSLERQRVACVAEMKKNRDSSCLSDLPIKLDKFTEKFLIGKTALLFEDELIRISKNKKKIDETLEILGTLIRDSRANGAHVYANYLVELRDTLLEMKQQRLAEQRKG